MRKKKLTFLASDNAEAIEAKNVLQERYSDVGLDYADAVVEEFNLDPQDLI